MARTMRINLSTKEYLLRHDWPADCFVQGGERGLVLTKKGAANEVFQDPAKAGELLKAIVTKAEVPDSYRTAYFEAFPKTGRHEPFLRGEGKTLEEAEDATWAKWQSVKDCPHPGFEARGYENGAGFCTGCKMFASGVLPEIKHPCATCGTPTRWSSHGGKWGCEAHPEYDPRFADLHRALGTGKGLHA